MIAKDIAIPIVFPDYRIAVGTPSLSVPVPFTNEKFNVPTVTAHVPFLGHAGILLINGTGGLSKYFEYGRYDKPDFIGVVMDRPVPDVRIDDTGRPTAATLKATLARISSPWGHGGRIEGAYIELAMGAFGRMAAYATARMAKNLDPKRAPYAITDNSCLHFAKGAADAGGASMPAIFDPRPNGYIDKVQASFPALDFHPPASLSIQGITLS